MSHEYDDPVTPENIERAARQAFDLWLERPGTDLHCHVAAAVQQTFCGCATSIQDAIENRLSGLHAEILGAVQTRAAEIVQRRKSEASDLVDEASQESFPASDAPAWIHRRY